MIEMYKRGAAYYLLVAPFFLKDDIKACGFWWHPTTDKCVSTCRACKLEVPGKMWWTDSTAKAKKLYQTLDGLVQRFFDEDGWQSKQSSSMRPINGTKIIVPEGKELYPFQVAGVQTMLERSHNLLADDPGLGKTAQAIAFMNTIKAQKILLLCPKSLKLNWCSELENWMEPALSAQVLNKRDDILEDKNITVCNFDIIVGDDSTVIHQLCERSFDLLIVDEAHVLKGRHSQRNTVVFGKWNNTTQRQENGLVHRASRLLFLTGTPIPNKPVEGFSMFAACHPEFSNWMEYAKTYCDARQEMMKAYNGQRILAWNVDGASNLAKLNFKLRSTIMTARMKRDVLTDLPAKTRQILLLDSTGVSEVEEEKNIINKVVPYGADDLEAYDPEKVVKLQDVAKLRVQLAKAKIEPTAKIVSNMIDGGTSKIVIFAHHKVLIDGLADKLKDYGCCVITGQTSQYDRKNAIDTFQSFPEAHVFIGNIQAAGVGITLTAASTVVMAESSFVPAEVTQAEDRCHRIGQKSAVNIIHLVFKGSYDERIVRILLNKQKIIDAAINNKGV